MRDQFQQKRVLMERQLVEQKQQVRNSKSRDLSATNQAVLLEVGTEKAKSVPLTNQCILAHIFLLEFILTFFYILYCEAAPARQAWH